MNRHVPTADLELAHRRAAGLVLKDPAFAPVFERLDEELRARERLESDPVARARKLLEGTK